ncbi:FAD-dependent oxidoreductase [Streptomyces sp. NBC_00988]|uniref:NAD(P)/FAD-dependent oxidoreductase n=1 Tax=Streptomyces sp. NBC_00988 TaxID=2903704 RepID=UPI0038688AE4|nr:FAD-dependent oxidoreductase [Streptomyces sp. NBC_00988]
MRNLVVVGASLAGLSAARALRARGYDGRLLLVGAEDIPPYDRPPLSKDYLLGRAQAADLALTTDSDTALDLEWRLGWRAVRLDAAERAVELDDGTRVVTDGVVVATGATAVPLPGTARLAGVHLLRTLADAEALRAELRPGARLVVVGAGLIGAEAASSAAALGLNVTVVERGPAPLTRILGRVGNEVSAALHAEHGIRLITGAAVTELAGRDRVTGVLLADGRLLPADVVLVAIGSRPSVDWLAGSGLELDDGVVCDAGCATALPNVVAVGDCARPYHPWLRRHHRAQHWTAALEQPEVAAARLLDGPGGSSAYTSAPYFWSDQFGVRIQFAGHTGPDDRVEITDGSFEERSFLAVFRRGELPTAVLAMNRPKLFGRARRLIAAAGPLPAAQRPR